MDQPDELSEMTIPELDYIVARARTLDSQLTEKQVLVVLASAIACGFRIVRKDWMERACNQHDDWAEIQPTVGRPN